MIEDNLDAFYSRGVPMVNVWMAVSFVVKMKLHEVSFTSPSTIMYLACLVLSFFTDMAMNMKFVTGQFRGRWVIAYVSTILQITAATALMLFFNTDTLPVLVLFGLVLVLLIYLFFQMPGLGKEHGLRWLEVKELLNRRFEMCALVVAPSVAGLSGRVLGYMEDSSNLMGGHTALAPECFLFYSSVSGLLVVLFCTVPPSLSARRYVMDMVKIYIPVIAYMALWFLVVATLMAAQKILQEYLFLVCFAIAIFALLLFLCDGDAGAGSSPIDDVRQGQAKLTKYLFTVGMSPILLAVMAIHSRYGIGSGSTVSLSWSWKAFLSSAVCCILSNIVRILILDQMTERKRYEISTKFWTVGTWVTIASTLVFAVFVICMHTDEVKNIF